MIKHTREKQVKIVATGLGIVGAHIDKLVLCESAQKHLFIGQSMLIVANCNFHNKANSFLTKSVGAQKNSFGQSIFTCIYKIYQPG